MSGIGDYNFEDKNRWRIMMWSRIAARLKRVGKTPANSVVLYLAGPQDLDRRVAVNKGFKHHNLLAVDTSSVNVRRVREAGHLSIRGDIVQVLANWTHPVVPDVIFGDYCAGLTEGTALAFIKAFLCGAPLTNPVLAFNFQRGRDAWSNSLRASLFPFAEEEAPDDAALNGWAELCRLGYTGDLRHRGRQFIYLLWLCLKGTPLNSEQDADMVADFVLRQARADFLSYRSGVTMDSVVFTLHLTAKGVRSGAERWERAHELRNERLGRQLAAVMAHRTMRLGLTSRGVSA